LINRKGRNPDSYRDMQVCKDSVFLIFHTEAENTKRIQFNIFLKKKTILKLFNSIWNELNNYKMAFNLNL